MAIERTSPMVMHKNVVICVLLEHPEDLATVSPDWTGPSRNSLQHFAAIQMNGLLAACLETCRNSDNPARSRIVVGAPSR